MNKAKDAFFVSDELRCSLIETKANHDEDGVDVPSSSHAYSPHAGSDCMCIKKKEMEIKLNYTGISHLFFDLLTL